MGTIGIVLTLLMLAAVVGAVGYVAYCYIVAPPMITVNSLKPEDPPITRPSTVVDKLSYATKRSGTLFVQYVMGSLVMFGNAMLNMADFFGAPEVREWVTANLTPSVASSIIVIFVGITVWSRVRNATS